MPKKLPGPTTQGQYGLCDQHGSQAISSRKPFQTDAFTYSLNKHIWRQVLGTRRSLDTVPTFYDGGGTWVNGEG